MSQYWYDKEAQESARKYWESIAFGFKKEKFLNAMKKCKIREHYRSIL